MVVARLSHDALAHESALLTHPYGAGMVAVRGKVDPVEAQVIKGEGKRCQGGVRAVAARPVALVADDDAELRLAGYPVDIVKDGKADRRLGLPVGNDEQHPVARARYLADVLRGRRDGDGKDDIERRPYLRVVVPCMQERGVGLLHPAQSCQDSLHVASLRNGKQGLGWPQGRLRAVRTRRRRNTRGWPRPTPRRARSCCR